MCHSGQEGCSGDKKLIIDMSYIFKKVMKNAIQIHWNLQTDREEQMNRYDMTEKKVTTEPTLSVILCNSGGECLNIYLAF